MQTQINIARSHGLPLLPNKVRPTAHAQLPPGGEYRVQGGAGGRMSTRRLPYFTRGAPPA